MEKAKNEGKKKKKRKKGKCEVRQRDREARPTHLCHDAAAHAATPMPCRCDAVMLARRES